MSDENFEIADSSSTQKLSKFNSTISILMRIDDLWKDTHKHSRQGDLTKWNWDLDRVWCELAADAADEEEEAFKGFVKEIANCNENKSSLYHILLRKEIWLRKLQNKQGKGTAYQDSVDSYMD